MKYTPEQYSEWMKLPDWTILNDPDKHDLENADGEYYYTDNLLAKTPYGIIILRAGRIVNGASIPWIAQCIIPKSGKYNRPSGFHDVGFEDGGFWLLSEYGKMYFLKLPQRKVDIAYLKFMISRNVPKWNRNLQHRILRMLGFIKWNKYRKLDKKEDKKND